MSSPEQLSGEYIAQVAEEGKEQWLGRESNVESFLSQLRNFYPDLTQVVALDAGAAQGRDSAELRAAGLTVVSLDNEEKFVQEAKDADPEAQILLGDIEALPFADQSFNAVYCVNTLFYTNLSRSIPELARIIKEGGVMFVTLDERIVKQGKKNEANIGGESTASQEPDGNNGDEIIYASDVEESKDLIERQGCQVVYDAYAERLDQVPFVHTHYFHEVAARKATQDPDLPSTEDNGNLL
jgi:SAM-dependent methyltransferase